MMTVYVLQRKEDRSTRTIADGQPIVTLFMSADCAGKNGVKHEHHHDSFFVRVCVCVLS